MKQRITHVAPLQLGMVLAILYGLISFLFVPFLVLASLAGHHGEAVRGLVFICLLPIFYAIFGFVGGVVGAAVYNLVAGWTGGIEFTTSGVPSTV